MEATEMTKTRKLAKETTRQRLFKKMQCVCFYVLLPSSEKKQVQIKQAHYAPPYAFSRMPGMFVMDKKFGMMHKNG